MIANEKKLVFDKFLNNLLIRLAFNYVSELYVSKFMSKFIKIKIYLLYKDFN